MIDSYLELIVNASEGAESSSAKRATKTDAEEVIIEQAGGDQKGEKVSAMKQAN